MTANTNSESHSAPVGSVSERAASTVDWEARYLAGDTPWDKGQAAPALTEFLSRQPIRGEVLVPGSGTGHDVRALASQQGGASVTGLDLSFTAIQLALSFPPAGGERYEMGDLFHLPPSWNGRFDWVVEHTCFCAIPPGRRADYLTAVSRLLKPGGALFAIFLLDADVTQGPPHASTQEEIDSLFRLHLPLEREWKPSEVFPERAGGEICQLRHKRFGP